MRHGVTLRESVNVGNQVLPGGDYKVSDIRMGESGSFFVFRDNKNETVAVAAGLKDVTPAGKQTTQVVLRPREDGDVRPDKLFAEGDSSGFRFVNAK